MNLLEVCICDPLELDLAAFNLWLEGVGVAEAARELGQLCLKSEWEWERQLGADARQLLVLKEASEQYRLFVMLKPCLDEPLLLVTQPRHRMPLHVRQTLLDTYYSFEARVMRELLGKKPTSKLRRQLDFACERLNVSSQSCRRQFDNMQRIFTWTEEHDGTGSVGVSNEAGAIASRESGGGSAPLLVEHLCATFLLSRTLALRYVHALFLCIHQFECSKRRLLCLTYADWEVFAALLLRQWTDLPSGHDIDPELTLALSQTRNYLSEQRPMAALQQAVQQALLASSNPPVASPSAALSSSSSPQKGRLLSVPSKPFVSLVNAKLPRLLKTLLELGASLSSPKELRELFVHLAELADMLKLSMGLSETEASTLLESIDEGFAEVTSSTSLKSAWRRFLAGVSPIVVRFMIGEKNAAPEQGKA